MSQKSVFFRFWKWLNLTPPIFKLRKFYFCEFKLLLLSSECLFFQKFQTNMWRIFRIKQTRYYGITTWKKAHWKNCYCPISENNNSAERKIILLDNLRLRYNECARITIGNYEFYDYILGSMNFHLFERAARFLSSRRCRALSHFAHRNIANTLTESWICVGLVIAPLNFDVPRSPSSCPNNWHVCPSIYRDVNFLRWRRIMNEICPPENFMIFK